MDNIINTDQQLNPSLDTFYNSLKEEIHQRFVYFSERLNKKRDELKLAFRQKLVEAQNMNKDIKGLQENISQEPKNKETLMEETKKLRNQVDELINRMELLESYSTKLKEMKLNEILKFSNEDFEIAMDIFQEKITESKAGDSSAATIPSNACKQCRQPLTWGYSYHTQKCGFSNNCNTHYKYACNSCSISYCSSCAYPRDINQCGCGINLSYVPAPYHNCDLCRTSISDSCYRCSSCDYDVCNECYNKYLNMQ